MKFTTQKRVSVQKLKTKHKINLLSGWHFDTLNISNSTQHTGKVTKQRRITRQHKSEEKTKNKRKNSQFTKLVVICCDIELVRKLTLSRKLTLAHIDRTHYPLINVHRREKSIKNLTNRWHLASTHSNPCSHKQKHPLFMYHRRGITEKRPRGTLKWYLTRNWEFEQRMGYVFITIKFVHLPIYIFICRCQTHKNKFAIFFAHTLLQATE